MNIVMIQGRISQEIQARFTKTGKAVTSFSVAVNNGKKNGEGKDLADFFNVTCWNTIAEVVANTMSKGDLVFVQGRLQNSSWEDQQSGQKRHKTEIVADLVAQGVVSEQKTLQPQQPKADAAKVFGGQQVFPPNDDPPF